MQIVAATAANLTDIRAAYAAGRRIQRERGGATTGASDFG